MASRDGFGPLVAKLGQIENHLSGGNIRKITNAVAFDAKKDVRKEAESDLGSDRKMSGWGRFTFDASYKLTSDSTAEITPKPKGPWVVLIKGRKYKRTGQPKRRRSKVYRTPEGLRTATKAKPFVQGRTRGKGTWDRAAKVMERETPKRIHRHTNDILKKVFK